MFKGVPNMFGNDPRTDSSLMVVLAESVAKITSLLYEVLTASWRKLVIPDGRVRFISMRVGQV